MLWLVCSGICVVFERHSQATSFYGGSPGVPQGLYSSLQGKRMGLGLVLERSESGYVSRSLLSVIGLSTGFIRMHTPRCRMCSNAPNLDTVDIGLKQEEVALAVG